MATLTAPSAVTAAGKPTRPWFKKKRFILPGAALAIIIAASAASSGGDPKVTSMPDPTVAPTASQPQASAPEVVAPVAPKAVAPAVPKVAPAVAQYNEAYGTFTRILKSGRGDATIALPKSATAGLVTATHKGSSNFQISGLDSGNQLTTDGLVNEIGNYSGTTAYGLLDMGSPSVKLKISADGAWTIKIAPIASARVLPAATSGKGDAVFRFDGDAVDYAITHKGESNFQVQQYGGDMSMGVNEIGNYKGTVPFVSGPTVLVVGADGTWTFKQN